MGTFAKLTKYTSPSIHSDYIRKKSVNFILELTKRSTSLLRRGLPFSLALFGEFFKVIQFLRHISPQ